MFKLKRKVTSGASYYRSEAVLNENVASRSTWPSVHRLAGLGTGLRFTLAESVVWTGFGDRILDEGTASAAVLGRSVCAV